MKRQTIQFTAALFFAALAVWQFSKSTIEDPAGYAFTGVAGGILIGLALSKIKTKSTNG